MLMDDIGYVYSPYMLPCAFGTRSTATSVRYITNMKEARMAHWALHVPLSRTYQFVYAHISDVPRFHGMLEFVLL